MFENLPIIGSGLLTGLAGSATTLLGVLIYSQVKSSGQSFVGGKASEELSEFTIQNDDDLTDGTRVRFHAYNTEGVYRGVENHIKVELDDGGLAHLPLDAYEKRWDSWDDAEAAGNDN